VESIRARVKELWGDPDRRRAFMLSIVLHLCFLLGLMLWITRPAPVELEQFIVLDLGSPAPAEEAVTAATVDDPAPAAPTPQVAETETGEPQARTAQEEVTTAPEPEVTTEQPPAPEPAEAARQPVEAQEAQEVPPAAPQEEVAQATEPEPEQAQAQETPPAAPTPQLQEPMPESVAADLPEAVPASVLPEVDEVFVEPQPSEQPLEIPQPQSAAVLPESRNVSVEPTARVSQAQEVPLPSVQAQVESSEQIPQPEAQARVEQSEVVPRPEASVNVSASSTIPTPQVQTEVAQAQAVPVPQVSTAVTGATPVPAPSATASVAGARELPLPGAVAVTGATRDVAVEPQVTVNRPVPQAEPQVAAQEEGEEVVPGAQMAGAAPEGSAQNPSNRLDDRSPGGNAARAGQDTPDEQASADALGRAQGEEGDSTGAQSPRTPLPYREETMRPLAVVIDNVNGYPQSGLREASVIAEMPVEGGLTRLMTFYDRTDPDMVGPVRSARDYFVDLAQAYEGVLVHDGGSPTALQLIERSPFPTLNAYTAGGLFSRDTGRQAPYNLYAAGRGLRQAVQEMNLGRIVEILGVVPTAPQEAAQAAGATVRFSGAYESSFRYVPESNQYEWLRGGSPARDSGGAPVHVDAVLLASIQAREIPDDPAGRLYIRLAGGDADLLLDGRIISGSWTIGQGNGVGFVSDAGDSYDLDPFKLWVSFVPQSSQVAMR